MNRPFAPKPSPAKWDSDMTTVQVEINLRRRARKIVEQIDL